MWILEKTLSKRLHDNYKQRLHRFFFWLDSFLEKQSLIPNDPVLEAAQFPWVGELERHWRDIQGELTTLLQYRSHMPLFQDISPDQKRISPDDKWKVFVLYGFGYRVDANCQICPETARILDRIPGIQNAFFSILAPGKIIPEHRGITKGLIRCHLGLVVPSDETGCYMNVGPVRCTWTEGRALLFDDTYPHSVANSCDQERVVLLLDFPRPLALPGRLFRGALFWIFRRSSYVKVALRNEAQWEGKNTPWMSRLQSEKEELAEKARLAGQPAKLPNGDGGQRDDAPTPMLAGIGPEFTEARSGLGHG